MSRPFPFDARIAELPRALDGSIAGGLFEKYLCGADNQPMQVQECRVVRLRYRPEDRCILQYQVTVAGAGAAGPRRELVSGTLYADPRRAARRAQRLNGVTFIPELRMLASVFPSDRKLPQAAVVMSGTDAAMKAAVLRAFGNGTWHEERWTSEVIRYREGLSLVVRYSVRAREATTGTVVERVFYVKSYPEIDAAARALADLERLALYSAAAGLAIRIAPPLACVDHLRAVLLPATPGRPLNEIIASAPDEALLAAMKSAARGLASFNLSEAPMTRQFSTGDYWRSLRRPAQLLMRACPAHAAGLHHIVEAARTLADGERRPTHRDMKPEHVLIGDRGAALIDLDSSATADPALDAALMLARFAALAIVDQRPERIRAAAVAFAREYFASVPARWRRQLPVYYAASIMEVAGGLFHRQEDEWRSHVPSLLSTARKALLDFHDLSVEAIGLLTADARERLDREAAAAAP